MLPGYLCSTKAVTATKVDVDIGVNSNATKRFIAPFAATTEGSTSIRRFVLSTAGPMVAPSEVPAVIVPHASVAMALDRRY